jgi:hypothetical protein
MTTSSVHVLRRVRRMLERLAEQAPQERRAALAERLTQLPA